VTVVFPIAQALDILLAWVREKAQHIPFPLNQTPMYFIYAVDH
jgi:hypothetical protein